MGKKSDNRFKFSKPTLTQLEKRTNKNQFEKEAYIYDEASHLAIRIRPNQAFTECAFCLYERVRVKGGSGSRLFKRQIMKVGDARNGEVPLSELRQKADSLFLEIQEGQDPLALEKQNKEGEVKESKLDEIKRSTRDMLFGVPIEGEDEAPAECFVSERRPSASYLKDINEKFMVLCEDLLDKPLYSLTADDVKAVYNAKVTKGKTQLHNAMRICRSIWNWAEAKYEDSGLFLRNPVKSGMKQLGVNINKTNQRKVRLDDFDFEPYLNAVLGLRERDHPTALRNGRDSLLFMLFSGVRLAGTLTICNDGIDLERGRFKIIKKGGEVAELPLNSVTSAIVSNRFEHVERDSKYLFPGIRMNGGRYRDTRGSREIVKELSGVDVTSHDLRRTYKSIGSEENINATVIDELLCHTREGVDAHYVHPSMTKLRDASQKIADRILNESGVNLIGKLTEAW